MKSPTSRTLEYLRNNGWVVEVVERFNPHSKTRHDLFGVFDLLAIKYGMIVGVQCTSGAHHAERRTKILESELAVTWLLAGGQIALISWRKLAKKTDGRLWHERIEWITEEDWQ